jgi:hypothetical protein
MRVDRREGKSRQNPRAWPNVSAGLVNWVEGSSAPSIERQAGQPEPISCDPAGGIAGFAGAAHVRPLAINGAPRFDTDLSHQRGTSVPMAPHAIQAVSDKLTRDEAQIVLILHRESRPVLRIRATRPAGIASPNLEIRVGSLWRHTFYREPQLGGAVTLNQVLATVAFERRCAPCPR